jgi:hypothetical protein
VGTYSNKFEIYDMIRCEKITKFKGIKMRIWITYILNICYKLILKIVRIIIYGLWIL